MEYKKSKVKLSDCYLRNRGLEAKPFNQKQSTLYKNVLQSIKENGLINPLTVVADGNKYKVCLGNNRYLACKELDIKEVNVIIVTNDDVKTLRNSYKYYEQVFENDKF